MPSPLPCKFGLKLNYQAGVYTIHTCNISDSQTDKGIKQKII